MRIGIKDVARAAGVSPATVSRTLAGQGVSDAMRVRVEQAIQKTGYRPNLAARRLRSQKNNTIGLIVADIRNPFFTAVARVIENIAEAKGYRIILCNTDENAQREADHLRRMEEERVTGVILAATPHGLEAVDHWPKDIPLVLIDRAAPRATFDTVAIDNYAAGGNLSEHLVAQEFKNIACLYGEHSITGAVRNSGYKDTMRQHGLKVMSVPIRHDRKAAREDIEHFLKNVADTTDAVIVTNGVLLLFMVQALYEKGIRIPQQIALAGFDDEAWSSLVAGGITVISQPIDEIGYHAMSMLLSRSEDLDIGARQMILSSKLLPRRSTTKHF